MRKLHHSLKTHSLLEKLRKFGLFKIDQAEKIGISQATLSRLSQEGIIKRVSHGLYIHSESPIPPEQLDFSIAYKRFGKKSVICGISALFHYGLIDQVPMQIWLMVPADRHTYNKLYRLIRIKTPIDIGIIHNKNFDITNIERTLVEAFRYSSKIGLRNAIRASQRAIEGKKTSLEKISKMAKTLKLSNFIDPHWEALVATTEDAA